MFLFAVERRDRAGRLLGVTWAALPEEEPPPWAPFRAAALRHDFPPASESIGPGGGAAGPGGEGGSCHAVPGPE